MTGQDITADVVQVGERLSCSYRHTRRVTPEVAEAGR